MKMKIQSIKNTRHNENRNPKLTPTSKQNKKNFDKCENLITRIMEKSHTHTQTFETSSSSSNVIQKRRTTFEILYPCERNITKTKTKNSFENSE